MNGGWRSKIAGGAVCILSVGWLGVIQPLQEGYKQAAVLRSRGRRKGAGRGVAERARARERH